MLQGTLWIKKMIFQKKNKVSIINKQVPPNLCIVGEVKKDFEDIKNLLFNQKPRTVQVKCIAYAKHSCKYSHD